MEQILLKYLPKNQNIDFMNVDVEGLDLKVLRSNNWEVFRPKYLLVEMEGYFGADIRNMMSCDVYKFLEEKDYMLVGKVYRTGLYKCKRSV